MNIVSKSPFIGYIDNVLSDSDHRELFKKISHHGVLWKKHDSTFNWDRNGNPIDSSPFLKSASKGPNGEGSDATDNSYVHKIGSILASEIQKIDNRFNWKCFQVYVNNHFPGTSGGELHCDSRALCYSGLYYPMVEWPFDCMGQTIWVSSHDNDYSGLQCPQNFDDDPNLKKPIEILHSILPNPNRLAIFDGRIPHMATAVSSACAQERFSLAFKFYPSGKNGIRLEIPEYNNPDFYMDGEDYSNDEDLGF